MKILCIHQGAELYGSDRSFALCLEMLRGEFKHATIDVILPSDGPLVNAIRSHSTSIIFRPQVKIQRRDALFLFINKIVPTIAAGRVLRNIFRGYDIVYINTCVLIDALFASYLTPSVQRIVHVREIPPRRAQFLFSALIRLSRASVIFNSRATASSFQLAQDQASRVVLNGVQGYALSRPRPKFSSDRVRLLMIGRVNTWKGQDLLIDALALLPPSALGSLEVSLVGSAAPGCESLRSSLIQRFQSLTPLRFSAHDFSDTPSEFYDWADVVVVPSRLPEPFGLVAVESMSASCLTIGANHGGLSEIISHQSTGFLFEPNSASELSAAILRVLNSRTLSLELAHNGSREFSLQYSLDALRLRFISAFKQLSSFTGETS